jgi:hypothetical protein
MANKVLDIYLVYEFIKRLVKPFETWDAYKLGIIDKDGNVLKKKGTLETPEENNAWGRFDILVANLKKLLAKIPGGSSKLATIAAATYLLLKEEQLNEEIDEQDFMQYMQEQLEEDIANNVGGGQIAGLGVGPQGEPPMGKSAQLKRLKKMLRRKQPNVRNG